MLAVVTGASRGVGRGIAIALANAGYTVYATGRTIAAADLPASIHRRTCDHADDATVARVFEELPQSGAELVLLVNNAWGGYERMVEQGKFTWPLPFWEQPLWRWDAMMGSGVRAAFVASRHAARLMVRARRGLIVNISSWAAQKYAGNLVYSLAKAATDRLSADMARELRAHNVAAVSLYPGLVRTELVVSAGVFDLSNSESPEFIGRAVAALNADPNVMSKSGLPLVAAALASEYGFTDVDGRVPKPLTLAEA